MLTAHEFARRLLDGPDLRIVTRSPDPEDYCLRDPIASPISSLPANNEQVHMLQILGQIPDSPRPEAP